MARRADVEAGLRAVGDSLQDLAREVDRIGRSTEKMELILLVREPGSAAAADAYDGLRKQVVASRSERTAHLNQLVQFDAALRGGAAAGELGAMVEGWVSASGMERIFQPDPGAPERFVVVADGGGAAEVLEPAYVDLQSGQTIRAGRLRYLDRVEAPSPPAPVPPVTDDSMPPPAAATEEELGA